jgi:hypothetical protein
VGCGGHRHQLTGFERPTYDFFMPKSVRDQLLGGTRTSVGEAEQVVKKALTAAPLRREIYDLFLDDDPVVAMRASYVAMKLAQSDPATTHEFKKLILKNLSQYTQQEVRWHVPQLLVHMKLTAAERRNAYEVVMEWSETDASKIVAYYGLQAAADFAEADDALLEDLIPRLRKLNARGAKSVSNRCKKIAKQLEIEL